MKVKRYVGDNIQDTIFKVKADLGSDAIILNTRKFKEKGFLGLFGSQKVEVMAALEDEPQKPVKNDETLKEIHDIKKMVSNLEKSWEKKSQFEGEPGRVYDHLLQQGVKHNLAEEFVSNIIAEIKDNDSEFYDRVFESTVKLIGPSAPIKLGNKNKVVAFIGPTGVGKTTTIAKLAAKFSLEDNIKVKLVTADTYRIAAVQQLETYSEIMNIPLKVVYNEKELKDSLREDREEFDLILLDTAGSSWSDKLQLGRLQGFTASELIDETHLLISLNTKSEDQIEVINHFGRLAPDKLLLTKIDETNTFGDVFNLRKEFDYPFSYITYGQDVPDDIEEAVPQKLTEFLLGDLNE